MFLFHLAKGCSNIVSRDEAEFQIIFLALDFPVSNLAWLEISNSSTENGCIGRGKSFSGCLIHFLATFYIDAMNGFGTAERNRTCNQRNLSTPTAALFSKGEAHFAGRIIADETYRVNLFVSWSGCNHDFLAFQIELIAFFFLAVF